MYAFLDGLMAKGLPWKQQSESDLSRNDMRHVKVGFRQYRGSQKCSRPREAINN